MILGSDKCSEDSKQRRGRQGRVTRGGDTWAEPSLKWWHEPWVFGRKSILRCSANILRWECTWKYGETSRKPGYWSRVREYSRKQKSPIRTCRGGNLGIYSKCVERPWVVWSRKVTWSHLFLNQKQCGESQQWKHILFFSFIQHQDMNVNTTGPMCSILKLFFKDFFFFLL